MSDKYAEYERVSPLRLDFHEPSDEMSERIAVGIWRDNQKKSSVLGMILSSIAIVLFACIYFFAGRSSYAIIMAVIFAALFVCMVANYRKIMNTPVMVATTVAVDKYIKRTYWGTKVHHASTCFVDVCQKENRIVAEGIRISEAQYQFCCEDKEVFIIKCNGQIEAVNGY